MGTRPGAQKTIADRDVHEVQRERLPSKHKKLPAVPFDQQESLAELAANEEPPRLAQSVSRPLQRRSKSTPELASPELASPHPPSPNTHIKNPLLVPPKDGASQRSRGSSARSESIQIALWPSQQYDAERENPVLLKVSTPLPLIPNRWYHILFVVKHNVQKYTLTTKQQDLTPSPRPLTSFAADTLILDKQGMWRHSTC